MALCAGCNAVHPYAAFIIGVIAGMAYVAWSTLVLYFRVDDPLDAVAGKETIPLTPNIKEQIFLSCPHIFLVNLLGRSYFNIKKSHLGCNVNLGARNPDTKHTVNTK